MNFMFIVLCLLLRNVKGELSSDEAADVADTCCKHGQSFAMTTSSCSAVQPPDDIEEEQRGACLEPLKSCCEQQLEQIDECNAGMKLAISKRCSVPKSDIGRMCCDECSFGALAGESQGIDGCGELDSYSYSPRSTLRSNAFYHCCVEATKRVETTTEQKTTTTEPTTTTTAKPREKCKENSCDHVCSDADGVVRCQCREGFRLQPDNKSCKDINECLEATEDLCLAEGTVCHNTEGAFKCVPIKKRDVSLSCPPGFKRNVQNQVCDDINECQLPRPPCPKYLCKNTIGGYTCAGKSGKPFLEAGPSGATTDASVSSTPAVKNDICPPGFRAGPDDECLDIDECEEHLDDCQRLSQYCINTHGAFFCQDHVSKRCAPGFKVNALGVCEDIDECDESSDICKRTEVCINLPGAYNCKPKISTLPKLVPKTCQEGTRMGPGGGSCEDIDECREGTHLCDQFQNCINTYGGHECRCKNGFELDSTSGSCTDVDECALKLDNCAAGMHCLNVLGSFTCTRSPITTTTIPPPPALPSAPPNEYEYEYYDVDEDTSPPPAPAPTTKPTTRRSTTTLATTQPPTTTTTSKPTTQRQTTTQRPTRRPSTTQRATTRRPITTSTTTVKPYEPTQPRPNQWRPDNPDIPVVDVPKPNNTAFIEKERKPDGSYDINTSNIPEGTWTNVIRKDPEPKEDDRLFCLNGYERNERGECVDTDECKLNRHICGPLENCKNVEGGYECECVPGFTRESSGYCVPVTYPTTTRTTPRTTSRVTTPRVPSRTNPRPTPRTTTPRPTSRTTPRTTTVPTTTPRRSTTTTATTTSTSTTTIVPSYPEYTPVSHGSRGRPYYPNYPTPPPVVGSCDFGYTYSSNQRRCIDIDECATNKASCAPNEDCLNSDGGYKCVCGWRCRSENGVIPYAPRPREPSVITVGSQYGTRGTRYVRPKVSREPGVGAQVFSCPWGYRLTPDRFCIDIDECANNNSECGPEQRCENFYGGYSCQCPPGHRHQDGRCEDIDECGYGNTCPYNARCVNTVGSYKCDCGEGFQNAPSNDKVCVDVDECAQPNLCDHGCVNSWGSYRCFCNRGYRLQADNRTCLDVDECVEYGSSRARLCGGRCVNTAGSYRCSCPPGYRLGDDLRSCIDIDECENGEARCASAAAGGVCQNTRGGYHCHQITCPPGYRLEGRHKCTRVQTSCPVSDWGCLRQPSSYSYNFITFVSNIYLPQGSVNLFTMHGPLWPDAELRFEMNMLEVQAGAGVTPADLSCFHMQPTRNVCVVSLQCALMGPQVAELELTMSLYQRGMFGGSAVARLIVIVSEYEF